MVFILFIVALVIGLFGIIYAISYIEDLHTKVLCIFMNSLIIFINVLIYVINSNMVQHDVII